MTAEAFMFMVFKIAGCTAIAAFIVSLSVIVVYYSYKMAEGAIKKRKKYVNRIKKSHAFQSFNTGGTNLQVVQKNGKKAVVKQ